LPLRCTTKQEARGAHGSTGARLFEAAKLAIAKSTAISNFMELTDRPSPQSGIIDQTGTEKEPTYCQSVPSGLRTSSLQSEAPLPLAVCLGSQFHLPQQVSISIRRSYLPRTYKPPRTFLLLNTVPPFKAFSPLPLPQTVQLPPPTSALCALSRRTNSSLFHHLLSQILLSITATYLSTS
jgi:hypothetical protein